MWGGCAIGGREERAAPSRSEKYPRRERDAIRPAAVSKYANTGSHTMARDVNFARGKIVWIWKKATKHV